MNQDFKKLYLRDLDRLKTECESYAEEKLWVKADGIGNSGGNLIMHLCGNLQHFIGAVLSDSGYVRDREFEFSGKRSQAELIHEIEQTQKVLTAYFEQVSEESLSDKYPIEPFNYPMSVSHFLLHLLGHLNYHLGQINYHRRILS